MHGARGRKRRCPRASVGCAPAGKEGGFGVVFVFLFTAWNACLSYAHNFRFKVLVSFRCLV